tara:strand:+ start:159 stop:422 length:264 start_codon:yes stop_codon:yes gene_type:complete
MKNKIGNIEASYTTTLHWNVEDIAESEGFKLEDVDKVEVGKWATLYIFLKNGKSIDAEATLDTNNTDYKWADNERHYDKDWNLLEKE